MCGITGIVSKNRNVLPDILDLAAAQNNRGAQGCGAAVFDGKETRFYYGIGKISEGFSEQNQEKWGKLVGFAATVQTLYSTVGRGGKKPQPKTQQPIPFCHNGMVGAVSHNGNLVELQNLRRQAKRAGYKFKSNISDTEVIAALLSISKKRDFLEALLEVLKKIEGKGSFSLVILYGDKIYGVRDQNGIRPLCIIKKNGKNSDHDSYILASESCVFPTLEATRFVREVGIGELVVIGSSGIENSIQWTNKTKSAFCVCELIYLSHPASKYSGRSVYSFRKKAGAMSAKKHPAEVDVVVPVPESGRGYNDGWAEESGVPSNDGLIKSRYPRKGTNRTFMDSREVNKGSRQNPLQAICDVMEDKRVLLVEDSIFRASVAPAVIKMSREHGLARQLHVRVCSPPACFRCHLGLDTATKKELVAANMTVGQIRDKVLHCDSLEYLTVNELKQVLVEMGFSPNDFCLGCFTGEYPVPPPK